MGETRETNRDLLDQQAARSGRAKRDAGRGVRLRLARESLDRGDFARAASNSWARRWSWIRSSVEGRRMLGLMVEQARSKGNVWTRGRQARSRAVIAARVGRRQEASRTHEDEEELAEMEPAEAPEDAAFEGPARNGVGRGGRRCGRRVPRPRRSSRGAATRALDVRRTSRRLRSPCGRRTRRWQTTRPMRTARACRTSRRSRVWGSQHRRVGSRYAALSDARRFVCGPDRTQDVQRHRALGAARSRPIPKAAPSIKVKLPDNLTTWRAIVRGVSKQALVGSGRGGVADRTQARHRADRRAAVPDAGRRVHDPDRGPQPDRGCA